MSSSLPLASSLPTAPEQANRPLRILHLTFASDVDGLSRYIFDLGFAMHALGHQFAVAGHRGSWHWLFESAPFPWIDVSFRAGPIGMNRTVAVLSQYLQEHPVDILHSHYRRCTQTARRIQHQFPVPILYTPHLYDTEPKWWRRDFTDFGDHSHVTSDDSRQWLIRHGTVPQELISMIPHGIDQKRFPAADADTKAAAKTAMGIQLTDLVAAYVGRLGDPKNEGWMLDLATASRQRLPNLKILMVGEGPHEKRLRRRVRTEKLQDRVVLLGHRDPKVIYHAADALLLPSDREGFSLVCAEAMSTGIPVLRTRTAGANELIVENATGKSVPIDHDAFIAGSIEFLSDPVALKRMGRLAAIHIKEHFTFERQLNDTIDMYRSLIKLGASLR
jgi:glycosyltransferase involved in cell wall biosynthesis